MGIRVHGVGTFPTLTEATGAWAKNKAAKYTAQEDETAETAAERIEAHIWAQLPEAPKGTAEDQWRDGCRYELSRALGGKRPTEYHGRAMAVSL